MLESPYKHTLIIFDGDTSTDVKHFLRSDNKVSAKQSVLQKNVTVTTGFFFFSQIHFLFIHFSSISLFRTLFSVFSYSQNVTKTWGASASLFYSN